MASAEPKTREEIARERCLRVRAHCIERYGADQPWPREELIKFGLSLAEVESLSDASLSSYSRIKPIDKDLVINFEYQDWRDKNPERWRLEQLCLKAHQFFGDNLPFSGGTKSVDSPRLETFVRFCMENVDRDSNEDWEPVYFYWALYDALHDRGLRCCTPTQFEGAIADVRQADENAEIREEERLAKEAAKLPAGRKPTDKTARVARITQALNVGERRALYIDRAGTAILEQRRVLADAFADDPMRNTPRAWEPRTGGSAGRWHVRFNGETFRAYVESGADAFEGDAVSAVLAVLADAYERGILADHFATGADLIEAICAERLGVDIAAALAAWDHYTAWRSLRKIRKIGA